MMRKTAMFVLPLISFMSVAACKNNIKTEGLSGAGKAVPAAATVDTDGGAGPVLKNPPPIEILAVELDPVASANYKYYSRNPIGRVAVRNNTDATMAGLRLDVFLKDFVDMPASRDIEAIPPRSTVNTDIRVAFNNSILTVTSDTTTQIHLSLSYYLNGEQKTISLDKQVTVLSKK